MTRPQDLTPTASPSGRTGVTRSLAVDMAQDLIERLAYDGAIGSTETVILRVAIGAAPPAVLEAELKAARHHPTDPAPAEPPTQA